MNAPGTPNSPDLPDTLAHVDGARFLADLDRLRTIGGRGTGVVRPAFGEADVEARLWLAGRFAEAGLVPRFDPVGNLFGMAPGEGTSLLIGSHSDTQVEGGWLDGAYGVVAGLEIARAAREAGGVPVSVVSFQDEEGRFGGLTGSAVWSGETILDEADALTDASGATLGEVRAACPSIRGERFVDPARFRAFVEPHIEQGPTLDDAGQSVAVVDGIVGFVNETVIFDGQQNHAGTTPMAVRRDAVRAFARFVTEIEAVFEGLSAPATVWTVGQVSVHPNADSIVPGTVRASLQIRDRDDALLRRMLVAAHEVLADVGTRYRVSTRTVGGATARSVTMDEGVVALLARAAASVLPEAGWRTMHSGALHDASKVCALMPTAMLFVASIGGLSHCFEEDTRREDLVAGLRVLAKAHALFGMPA